jgi:sugar fermentation stimulation protein A
VVSVHTNNTGTMLSCSTPGSRVWYSTSSNPKRKTPYTLHIVETEGGLVGVDTSVPGKVIVGALAADELPGFPGFVLVRREVTVVPGTRLDLELQGPEGRRVLMEVKNVTLARDGQAFFPDAVTTRGTRHVRELGHLATRGWSTAVGLVVQRQDVSRVYPADDIDPEFGKALRDARDAGVAILAWGCEVTTEGVRIRRTLPVDL